MGMFSNLMGKIFGHASAPASSAPAKPTTPATPSGAFPGSPGSVPTTPTTPAPDAPVPVSTVPAPGAVQSVDVTGILDGLAAKSSEDLDWRKSIVDLMKLVDMDSSLSARKELATELGFAGDEHDSAAMNIWLHKAVIKKLAENGGKVPAELLH